MKRRIILMVMLLIISTLTMTACDALMDSIEKIPVIGEFIEGLLHEHDFVNGECECGEKDPDYMPPHEHEFVNGECSCGESDPNYEPPHEHDFVNGECECGEKDPDYMPPHEHEFVNGECSCGESDPDYIPPHEHDFVNGECSCGESDPDYVPPSGPQYETVSYSFNAATAPVGKLSEDYLIAVFKVPADAETRSRDKTWTNPDDSTDKINFTHSVKFGSESSYVLISVPGTGTLTVYVQNGSSGKEYQYLHVTKPDGSTEDIEFVGTVSGSPVVRLQIPVTEGEWKLSRVPSSGGTVDLFGMDLTCEVEVSEESGFELVSSGKTEYLLGESIDISGVTLNAKFENGKLEPLALSSVTVDTSAFNSLQKGKYTITVSYKNYDPITYTVNVFEPKSLRLGIDAIEKLSTNTSYGNGVYFNHSFREVYSVGDNLLTSGLSVIAIAEDVDGNTKEFSVTSDSIISGFDSSVPGEQVLTVKYTYATGEVTKNISVFVVSTEPSYVNDTYQIKVDKAYEGQIGVIVDGYNMFTTIQQALDYIANSSSIKASAKKLISIASGTYNEKLEITIPNLKIVGAGAENTIIEWDSLYGLKDASGFTHETDSTATVAIREAAANCTIEDITISNAFNSKAYFDATLGVGYGEHRALALLVQSDMFKLKDARLLGYQDTVELFTGRQYFKDVYIQGLTDFIFGTNNTTLFDNCQIHSISVGKTDGGYITAFKGLNKNANDSIKYGAIFMNCRFTADSDVVANGNTAIGRPWGAYAAVAVINCELGGHISLKGSSGASKNERYVTMNAKPTDSTVQFFEYGNTGAGALTEAVAGMRFLTADEALEYTNIAIIFGKTNGNVTYLDAWDPMSDEVAEDKRTYYYFDQTVGASGTSYTFDIKTPSMNSGTLEFGDMILDATNGKIAWNANANAINMKAGALIRFSVKAGSEVTVTTYPNYNYFTINGVATSNASGITRYFRQDTEVVILSTGDLYLYSIIITPDSENSMAPTLEKIEVSGLKNNYTVGDEIDLTDVIVKAHYTDFAVIPVTDYTVNTDNVDNTEAGEYDVVFSFDGKQVSVKVTFEDPNAGPEINKNTILAFDTSIGLDKALNHPKVTSDFTSIRYNVAETQFTGTISFMVKAGTVVVVNPYSDPNYAHFTLGKADDTELETQHSVYSFFADEDCTVVYTGLSNNYIVSIEIRCPIKNESYVFGSGNTTEGDYVNVSESVGGLTIVGTTRDNGDSVQLSKDTSITFSVGAYSNIVITGHSKSYGQLLISVNGTPITEDSDANGVYTVFTAVAAEINIKALNVGTEDAPAYNQSYLKAISVKMIDFVSQDTTISFGSAGNYKEAVAGVDLSNIDIRDNGDNNCQIKNGYITVNLTKGSTLTVNGYPGYTSYTLGDGTNVTAEITETEYSYTATDNVILTITPVSGNNYFYSIVITVA